MTRRQVAVVALIVVVASTLSALVAYRRALRRTVENTGESALRSGAGPCVDFQVAGDHAGETTCVSGRVLRAFESRGGNVFLDFCRDYRQCPFTSVIFASDRAKFGNLETLAGREVQIQGRIVPYNGRAEIVIHDPEQIKTPN